MYSRCAGILPKSYTTLSEAELEHGGEIKCSSNALLRALATHGTLAKMLCGLLTVTHPPSPPDLIQAEYVYEIAFLLMSSPSIQHSAAESNRSWWITPAMSLRRNGSLLKFTCLGFAQWHSRFPLDTNNANVLNMTLTLSLNLKRGFSFVMTWWSFAISEEG